MPAASDPAPAPVSARPPGTGSAAGSWLSRQPPVVLALWAMAAAFTAYGCMYAFRKPFSAATYAGVGMFGIDYKALLVVSQLLGYTVSKFLGIKFVSEATAARRVGMVLLLIGTAELALLLFALTPAPWNAAWMVLNGLPLGMVWGLIFAFLEGRRVTEFMALGLSLSLVFSSGWVKAAGLHTMQAWHVTELWMPFVTGALFLPLLLLALWMLAVLPPPDAADMAARTRRQPMDREARHAFLRRYWVGVLLLVGGYLLLMTYRDVRDNFQVDILKDLGFKTDAGQLAAMETRVGFAVILMLGLFALIRSNRFALIGCCVLIAVGGVMAGAATVMLEKGQMEPLTWMTVTGVGLYAAFIPYQAILFERMLASLRVVGTASFLIAMCDSYGYLSTVILYLIKAFGHFSISWLKVLSAGGYVLGLGLPVLMTAAAVVLNRARPHSRPAES
ncbi:MAG: hypothetical protein JWM59_1265 [Verrucomicrobiales bacterium]|nr:hypothetical protein [Verrucomicrobiales bacterium]